MHYILEVDFSSQSGDELLGDRDAEADASLVHILHDVKVAEPLADLM